MGRTGRAGETGLAISIVNAKEVFYIKRLESTFEISISPKEMLLGKIVDPRKDPRKKAAPVKTKK